MHAVGGIDFAHEATGFLTWHRLLLLWFEREVQITIAGEKDFTLSYWDWTNKKEREGYFDTGHLRVSDEPFNSWPTYCWYETQDGTICNPLEPTANELRRCPIEEACKMNYPFWPSKEDVQQALKIESYDTAPFNNMASDSFRNYLEGFLPVKHCTAQEKLCVGSLNRKLHNSVS